MRAQNQKPINKQAAMVTQKAGKDFSFDEESDLRYRMSDKVWKAPKGKVEFSGGWKDNLIGIKLHRAEVVGYLGAGKFELRCVCGNYYQRKSKAIKSGRPSSGFCGACYRKYEMMRHNDYLKNGSGQHDIDWYILNR